MDDAEIDSFVRKFKLLRGAGIDASLNLESKLGEVFISLNCKVGRVSPPPDAPTNAPSKPRSPSYYRRLARRKAARDLNMEVEVVAEQARDEVITNKIETTSSEDAEEAKEDDSDEEAADYEEDVASESRLEDADQGSMLSGDLSKQLFSLIQESKKQRENWDRLKDSEQNR